MKNGSTAPALACSICDQQCQWRRHERQVSLAPTRAAAASLAMLLLRGWGAHRHRGHRARQSAPQDNQHCNFPVDTSEYCAASRVSRRQCSERNSCARITSSSRSRASANFATSGARAGPYSPTHQHLASQAIHPAAFRSTIHLASRPVLAQATPERPSSSCRRDVQLTCGPGAGMGTAGVSVPSATSSILTARDIPLATDWWSETCRAPTCHRAPSL